MREKEKIVYIVNSADMYGGATKSLLTLLDGVSKQGFNPIVVTPSRDGLFIEAKQRGYNVVYAPMRPDVYPKIHSLIDIILYPLRLLYWHILNHKTEKQLYSLFKNKHVSIIHTNVSVMSVGLKLAKRLHTEHVMHFREYGDLDFCFRYFPSKSTYMKRFYSVKSYAIAITRSILSHHGLSDYDRAEVIYNGIISSADTQLYTSSKADYFLYAGRICAAKGLLHLVRAYCSYAECEKNEFLLPLYVAGGIENEAYMECVKQYIKEHRQTCNVKFLGERNDIKNLMQDARALIIPSEMEGFGRCMAEAMAVGCLCIGHDTGGTKEQFDNGLRLTGEEIGLRYTIEAELTSLLQRVAETPLHEFNVMKNRAKSTVGELYTTDKYVESVCNLYKRILKK